MFEYDASLSMRVEVMEAALTALFDTLPEGHAARAKLVELIQLKLDAVGFAPDRRHQLERMIARLSQAVDAQDLVHDRV